MRWIAVKLSSEHHGTRFGIYCHKRITENDEDKMVDIFDKDTTFDYAINNQVDLS